VEARGNTGWTQDGRKVTPGKAGVSLELPLEKRALGVVVKVWTEGVEPRFVGTEVGDLGRSSPEGLCGRLKV
jgi:hypothetical protein